MLSSVIYLSILLFLFLYPAPDNAAVLADETAPDCGALGDCLSSPIDCQEKCGCDKAYYYNETTGMCVLDITHLMQVVVTKYESEEDDIEMEADKVFRGIIITALSFITCAVIIVFSACVYCIRINYTDRALKNDVKALAKKLQRDQNVKKSVEKPTTMPKEESCNVVVQSAGIYVV